MFSNLIREFMKFMHISFDEFINANAKEIHAFLRLLKMLPQRAPGAPTEQPANITHKHLTSFGQIQIPKSKYQINHKMTNPQNFY
jgi:hypothetical protein